MCCYTTYVTKLDKRTDTERYTIQYIRDNIHLSELQDIYNVRLRESGFELERGIKESDRKLIKVKEFKKTTRYYEYKVATFTKSHQTLEKENLNLQKEVKALTTEIKT